MKLLKKIVACTNIYKKAAKARFVREITEHLQRCFFLHLQNKFKEQVSILLLVIHTLELKNHSIMTYCVEIVNNQSLHQL